jgi:hypothetical protein
LIRSLGLVATLSLASFHKQKDRAGFDSIKTENALGLMIGLIPGCHRWIAAFPCAIATQRTDGW